MKKSKLKANIIAVCDYATISNENKLTIEGFFNELTFKEIPSVLPRAYFVLVVEGIPLQTYRVEVSLQLAGENVIDKSYSDLALGSSGKANLVLELINLEIAKEGKYVFVAKHNGQTFASTSIQAIKED